MLAERHRPAGTARGQRLEREVRQHRVRRQAGHVCERRDRTNTCMDALFDIPAAVFAVCERSLQRLELEEQAPVLQKKSVEEPEAGYLERSKNNERRPHRTLRFRTSRNTLIAGR